MIQRNPIIRYRDKSLKQAHQGGSAQVLLLSLLICFELRDIPYLPSSYWYSYSESHCFVGATSINYGISQQPITDISQLMPKLCQNQSVICEGSFCIPGVRKCVCDLRMPVQFGRFCLRQVDIETKCFVTNQCNHTIKDAVCMDLNSNAILDSESSKFKLDQWQQLNELRQLSAVTKDVPKQTSQKNIITTTTASQEADLKKWSFDNSDAYRPRYITYGSRDDALFSNARNSPYEINYDTNELLSQNHTRRRTNNSINNDKLSNPLNQNPTSSPTISFNHNIRQETQIISNNNSDAPSFITSASTSTTTTSTAAETAAFTGSSQTTARSIKSINQTPDADAITLSSDTSDRSNSEMNSISTTTTSIYSNDLMNRKKMIIKSPSWPPGVCLCPFGFMFDSMLRKCLALSLADSHCQTDTDCKQIVMTHCSIETKKCECDEPLVWNQKELACVRPKPSTTTENPPTKKENGSFVDNLLPPLILAKLLPDHTMMLLFFVIMVILGTLIILKLTVKCFSSSSSALISPKSKKKKQPNQSNTLSPRSPYATLRRPDHKPSSQLSNFTQATRGRILNYDFEQEGPLNESDALHPPQSAGSSSTAPRPSGKGGRGMLEKGSSATLKASNKKQHKHHQIANELAQPQQQQKGSTANGSFDEPTIELNDNISISQLESESKSENSVLTIPGPPPTQQPPYMLASAMKGQGSAIAAAAAAVANKRIQMAQQKNLEQQSSGNLGNGSPVFL